MQFNLIHNWVKKLQDMVHRRFDFIPVCQLLRPRLDPLGF
jgi:hypothetical protein